MKNQGGSNIGDVPIVKDPSRLIKEGAHWGSMKMGLGWTEL
jgi:hypothetical protein